MKLREIRPNQDFKHGPKTYKKGRKYEVTGDEANYFIAAGWVGVPKEPETKELDIHDGKLGQTAEVK